MNGYIIEVCQKFDMKLILHITNFKGVESGLSCMIYFEVAKPSKCIFLGVKFNTSYKNLEAQRTILERDSFNGL